MPLQVRDIVRNSVKEKLARGEVVASMTVRLVPTVEIVRIAKSAGFDSVYIDLEHSSFSMQTASQISIMALEAGLPAFVRVPANTPEYISRVLDGGALGVIAPGVRSAGEARQVVGADPFKEKHADMRLVMNGLGFVHIQWGVPADYPYKSIREIFEKKGPITIGTTPPGGSDEWVMRKVFEFYKTTYNDVRNRGGKVILVSYSDLTTQYRDRNMDIFFANLAVPGAAIQEASLARKMRILPMDADLIAFMEGQGLSRGVIPKGSYKDVVNNDVDIPTIAMANTIVANAKVPEQDVYAFTRILLKNLDDVRRVHPAFKAFDPKDAVKLANVPLHPGAAKAYREARLLN